MIAFRNWLRKSSASVNDLVVQADQARDERSWGKAADLYRQILALAPKRAGTWVQYGHALREEGDAAAAIHAYAKSIALRPRSAETYLHLSRALAVMGRLDEASQNICAALEIDPTLPSAASELRGLNGLGASIDPIRLAKIFGHDMTRFWIEGAIDQASVGRIRGWALDVRSLDTPLTVEIVANGIVIGQLETELFRREIQDRFGGAGRFGFELKPPAGTLSADTSTKIEVRLKGVALPIAKAQTHTILPQANGNDATHTQSAASLESYSAYYNQYYARTPPLGISDLNDSFAFLINTSGCACDEIDSAVDRFMRDFGADNSLYLLVQDPVTFTNQQNKKRNLVANGSVKLLSSNNGIIEVSEFSHPYVLIVPADAVLSRDAPARLGAALGGGADIAYCDEDELVEVEGKTAQERHASPWLKPAFDPDLLMQTPYLGGTVAFRREALAETGLDLAAGPHIGADAVMRQQPHPNKVAHIPRVLVSRRRRPPVANTWVDRVARFMGTSALVDVHQDPLGARVDAVRIRRRPADGVTVTIVIPTRDGLDLLKPCIESILSSLPHNRCMTDILITDHESKEDSTLEYLNELQIDAPIPINVEKYNGKFNWSRMNNIAASKIRSDVIVFLNNDTIVLTKDWIDELASQVTRPNIGVVGARLLYEDDTIQHAGIVARNGPGKFLTHEGVGAPVINAGYLGRHSLMHRSVAVTGAAMAVQRHLFQELGGFDEALPVEGNDVDFCMRASAGGHAVLYDPHVTLYHLESKSRGFSHSGTKKAVAEAAAMTLWARWGKRFGRDPWVNPHFADIGQPFTMLAPPPH